MRFSIFFGVIMGIVLLIGADFAGKNGAESNELLFQIEAIESSVENETWTLAEEQSKELVNVYDRQKWKLQLIGDEEEYEELIQNINMLKAVISERDATQSKMLISRIRSIVDTIYSL